nr:unnamed protein product [Callosobruchus analis]
MRGVHRRDQNIGWYRTAQEEKWYLLDVASLIASQEIGSSSDIILNDSDFEEGPRVSAGLEDSDSDLSDAESEHTDHDTDSEQEFSDGDNIQDNLDDAMSGDVSNQETSSSSYFYGKSRYKWSRDPPTRDRRTPAHNIVTHLPGLRGSARLTNPTTPLQAWQLLFTDEILEVILKHTNAKITELSAKYHSENVTYVNHLSMSELNAFLAAKPEDKMTRKKFNVLLGKALIQEHLQERLSLNISREMKNIIRKELADRSLPEGWLTWKVHVLTREDILGTQADPQILNNLRFPLPTVGLARAFSPNCSFLSKKIYRDIKLKLLSWPLCVGLIIGPSSVTSRVRGSISQSELVLAALADLKPQLLSREEASRALTNCEDEDADVRSFVSASSRSKKTSSSRLDKLERSQAEMKSLLESLVRKLDHEEVNENALEYDSEGSQFSDDDGYQALQLAPPPSSSSVPWIPPASPMEEDFDFAPRTFEQEPSVPPPKPHIASQGISCQRLDELSFRQIRYTDVQKKLHAAPVFSALKINPALSKSLGTPSQSQDLLAKMDQTLGTDLSNNCKSGTLRDTLINILKWYKDSNEIPIERREGDRVKAKNNNKRFAVRWFVEGLKCTESHYCCSKAFQKFNVPAELSIRLHSEEKIKINTDQNHPVTQRIHKIHRNSIYQLLKGQDDVEIVTFSYDCKKNLALPKVPEKTAYFSLQLNFYHVAIVEGRPKGILNPSTIRSYMD